MNSLNKCIDYAIIIAGWETGQWIYRTFIRPIYF